MKKLQQERGLPEYKKIGDLLLDSKNYRLPENEAVNATQEQLLKILERDFDLNPIAESLIDKGYFREEPLVGIPNGKGKYIIVEGNRRLATLKFLIQPEFRKLSFQLKYWEDVAKRARYDLSEVPVIIHSSRDELIGILGFRHISGILKWDPLSKARYIYALIERKQGKVDFGEIARETGSKRSTIRDNYIAYRILIQARDNFDIDTKKFEENFSVFYRGLANPGITGFMGLNKDLPPDKLKRPIPSRNAMALQEVIEFIHGTTKVPPVLTDSRQLTELGEVLKNKAATEHLRRYRNLGQAFMLAGGEVMRLTENINQAIYYLKEALRDAYAYKDSEDVRLLMERLRQAADEVLKHYFH